MLLWQSALSAFALALAIAGNNSPARIAMMATTTSNSMRVNPMRRSIRAGGKQEERGQKGSNNAMFIVVLGSVGEHDTNSTPLTFGQSLSIETTNGSEP